MAGTNVYKKVIQRYGQLLKEGEFPEPEDRFNSFAMSNFRGGIGKTTLTFNLAYEVSRRHPLLLGDVCAQMNFSQLLMGEALDDAEYDINKLLRQELTPRRRDVEELTADDLMYSVKSHCTSFKGGKNVQLIPGSSELFLLPSLLYTQLSQASSFGGADRVAAIKDILFSMKYTFDEGRESLARAGQVAKSIIDTSPFFGGATHLAWGAAEALIIPVRVDQQSINSLKQTLEMLHSPDSDFNVWRDKAEIATKPVVHAIAMTHCGWSRQEEMIPDRATQHFLDEACKLADKYASVFSDPDNVSSRFFLLDDFLTAGRISGCERIPINNLKVGRFHTIEGKRLQVNKSAERYQKQLTAFASVV